MNIKTFSDIWDRTLGPLFESQNGQPPKCSWGYSKNQEILAKMASGEYTDDEIIKMIEAGKL